jgi:hypothetical protein
VTPGEDEIIRRIPAAGNVRVRHGCPVILSEVIWSNVVKEGI